VTDQRQRELAQNLEAVRSRLDAACRAAGRDPAEVTLVVVTKTFPAADVLRLAVLGVTDVGENRDQEAAPKAAAVAEHGARVRWHFVGQLQRNKCRSVVRYADMVHSVDSVRLANALAGAADQVRDRPLDALVQVSLDGDASRGGAVSGHVEPDVALERVLASVEAAAGLALFGLMAVAPLDWDPERAFDELAAVSARVRAEYPHAAVLSAGMSGDVEQAIQHGATHVRLGSAVLGNRASLM
jgi:PLP dependent protein